MTKTMVLRPRVSEKAYAMSQAGNTYVLEVPKSANKLTVASAVADQYGVTVETVNIVVSKGKAKRSFRKRSRPIQGRDKDVKKAYIRLKAGDSLNLFPAEEAEQKKPAKKAKKEAKS